VVNPSAPSTPLHSRIERGRSVLLAYLALTKTRIIEQLLVVTVPAMFLAQRGIPSVWLILATLIGGAAAAASAHALNCVVDADIDAMMKRTARRPLARGQVAPRNALIFGLVLGVLSALWLGLTTNWLAAGLSVSAIAFYVLVYTLLLKRRTSQNIVWGGAAGCMPVVIGWAAVSGTVHWPALVMFGVIFFWTPPHFWALAMRYKDDYAAAGVPMLPVVATPIQVSRRIVAYSWTMALWSLLLVPVTSWSRRRWVVPGSWPWPTGCTRRYGPVNRPSRCDCSTSRTPTCAACSSPSRWTPPWACPSSADPSTSSGLIRPHTK